VEEQSLPLFEIGHPGVQREALLRNILIGAKTATSYPLEEDNPEVLKAQVGELQMLIDSNNKPVAVVRITEVLITELSNVDESVAHDEGEGFIGVDDWRQVHEAHWLGEAYDSKFIGWQMPDNTKIVVERFKLESIG